MHLEFKKKKYVCLLTWHLIFSQESNGDYSLQKHKEILYNVQWIRLDLI